MSNREEGFTLVEVLVALAIVVLSFAVLFKAISSDLDRTRQARDQMVAASLLQSLLAQSAAAPQRGATHGAFANGVLWRLDVAPYADADANWPVDAVTVAATVSWRDGGRTQSRSLTTLRVLPKALPQ
jgi:general secretion pathway protein I